MKGEAAMQEQEILRIFNDFKANYDENASDEIWESHSRNFNNYWRDRILDDSIKELDEAELDKIIRILDRNAKGNRKGSQAVARAMVSQGTWRRMFREIKGNSRLRGLLNGIFYEKDEKTRMSLIDELYRMNEGKKNGLTGQSANALNAMLGALDATKYIHAISLRDRRKIIEYFGLSGGPDFDNDGPGKKILLSNSAIIKGFRGLGIKAKPRTLSRFLYESPLRPQWKPDSVLEVESESQPGIQTEENPDISLFYMESQLEDFLIENWDKTELGKEYDLIEENGELVSQQYATGIGKIDILAQDKKTKEYVVIELKKNQTSDNTVGQLTRYMGWLEEHKTNGEPTKGIIIAADYDDRLHYALKKVKDVEVYLYRVSFKLAEFSKPQPDRTK
jgi:hypothetical protein